MAVVVNFDVVADNAVGRTGDWFSAPTVGVEDMVSVAQPNTNIGASPKRAKATARLIIVMNLVRWSRKYADPDGT